MLWGVMGCSVMLWDALGSSEVSWDALTSRLTDFKMLSNALGCFKMLWKRSKTPKSFQIQEGRSINVATFTIIDSNPPLNPN